MAVFPFAKVATSYGLEAGFTAWKDSVAPLRSEQALCIRLAASEFIGQSTCSHCQIGPSLFPFSAAPGAVAPPITVVAG